MSVRIVPLILLLMIGCESFNNYTKVTNKKYTDDGRFYYEEKSGGMVKYYDRKTDQHKTTCRFEPTKSTHECWYYDTGGELSEYKKFYSNHHPKPAVWIWYVDGEVRYKVCYKETGENMECQ